MSDHSPTSMVTFKAQFWAQTFLCFFIFDSHINILKKKRLKRKFLHFLHTFVCSSFIFSVVILCCFVLKKQPAAVKHIAIHGGGGGGGGL